MNVQTMFEIQKRFNNTLIINTELDSYKLSARKNLQFQIHLGELANEKLRERGIEVVENQDIESRLKKPTGKTGVAFGLIESREGGRVKVINRDFEDNDEVKFKYFLGINKRDKFKTIIDSEIYYNQWYEFSPAEIGRASCRERV